MTSPAVVYESLLTELQGLMDKKEAQSDPFPFITLTFAQSLDGSIAAKQGGAPLRLSSEESMKMTHQLRAMHDGILVGIGTVLSDDPSLTTRLCPGPSPRPIILDSSLRCPPSAKFIQLRKEERDNAPIIVCNRSKSKELGFAERKRLLEAAGTHVVEAEGLNDLGLLFFMLKKDFGVKRIMVEGGAQVIRWFILSGLHLVDAVVITVAPMLVGGLVPTNPWNHEKPHLRLKILQTSLVQGDIVLLATAITDS